MHRDMEGVCCVCGMRTHIRRYTCKRCQSTLTISLSSPGHARELSLTARVFSGEKAKQMGLATAALPSRDELERHGLAVAQGIAAKSPVAVAGTKQVLLYQR